MKKIICFFCVMVFMLTGCSKIFEENTNNISNNNNMIYNNAYNYTDDDLDFLMKERGYSYEENYNNQVKSFHKKEILSLVKIKNNDIVNTSLFYEVFLNEESETFSVHGQLYKTDNEDEYYSNLVIRDSLVFEDKMIIKILENDIVIKEFSIEKVVK